MLSILPSSWMNTNGHGRWLLNGLACTAADTLDWDGWMAWWGLRLGKTGKQDSRNERWNRQMKIGTANAMIVMWRADADAGTEASCCSLVCPSFAIHALAIMCFAVVLKSTQPFSLAMGPTDILMVKNYFRACGDNSDSRINLIMNVEKFSENDKSCGWTSAG